MEELKKHGVIPDVIDHEPKSILDVCYGELKVTPGLVLTPSQVQEAPTVTYTGEPGAFYTLVLTDPDAPSREDPKFGEWHHWMVANIPGSDVSKGETKSAYIGSGPPQGTKHHRYIFLLYKQTEGKIDFCDLPTLTYCGDDRGCKKVKDFLLPKYKLSELIAATFFLAEYDEEVPKLYARLSAGSK